LALRAFEQSKTCILGERAGSKVVDEPTRFNRIFVSNRVSLGRVLLRGNPRSKPQ
jgi:hypothetical protein